MEPLIPFDIDSSKISTPPLAMALTQYFYEWSIATNTWQKVRASDPEPPTTLPPGKYDGQVIAVQ